MPAEFTSHTFIHPQLGNLTGRINVQLTPDVVHFRSIPFASIPARFRQSILLTSIPAGHSRDFTKYGTACSSPDQNNVHGKDVVIGGLLPGEEEMRFGEFDCLNLTVSAPKDVLGGSNGNPLPVMVYIHGGAFKVGKGHISAMHDTTRLVQMSVKEGHPVVIVSIHYRLHWLGFLACQDLINDAEAHNEPPSNFALYDQRNAFFWIHRFIEGFGGDSKHITAFGESAGAGSIALHMSTSVPLFNRAGIMSGTTATAPPVDLALKEVEYLALLQYLDIDVADPERLRKLREIPVDLLVESLSKIHIPVFSGLKHDSFFTRGFPNWWTEDKLIGDCSWVDDVMIGDSFFEGWIFSAELENISPSHIVNTITRALGPKHAAQLLGAYGLAANTDLNLAWTRCMYLFGDITFSNPTHKLANSLALSTTAKKRNIYRYHLTLRNPIPGSPFYQVPHHFVELLFLFGTLRERYSTQIARDLSDEVGKRWLKFGAGKEPWDRYEEDRKVMIISGDNKWVSRTKENDEKESKLTEEGPRRYREWEVISDVLKSIGTIETGELGAKKTIDWDDRGLVSLLWELGRPPAESA
ncbi:Alpha/Beta hydrolase protein [Bisporella sp. PMI_857]|nr:Alpha/Beta hydrolase protein [Bisporella sp. PMI_857]